MSIIWLQGTQVMTLTSALRRLLVEDTQAATDMTPAKAQKTLSCQFSKWSSYGRRIVARIVAGVLSTTLTGVH